MPKPTAELCIFIIARETFKTETKTKETFQVFILESICVFTFINIIWSFSMLFDSTDLKNCYFALNLNTIIKTMACGKCHP